MYRLLVISFAHTDKNSEVHLMVTARTHDNSRCFVVAPGYKSIAGNSFICGSTDDQAVALYVRCRCYHSLQASEAVWKVLRINKIKQTAFASG